MSILMIGLVSAAAATTQMHDLRRQNRERVIAQNSIRSIAERIHAQSYRLSADPDTWASEMLDIFGPDGTFGASFEVEFLSPLVDGVDGGTLELITDETVADNEIGVTLGLPRDLNGDGDDDDTDVSDSARLLPVVLTLSWRGPTGEQSIRHGFYVMGY